MADETIGSPATPMTQEQEKAYNEFIDYMVELYNKFGYLVEEVKE